MGLDKMRLEDKHASWKIHSTLYLSNNHNSTIVVYNTGKDLILTFLTCRVYQKVSVSELVVSLTG